MKKFIVFLIGVLAVLLPVGARALEENYYSQDKANEVINHSIFTAGNSVNYNNNVNGASYIAGYDVTFGGSTEYGFLAANTLHVTGAVHNDLFAAGNIVVLDQEVGRDAYVAGNEVTINGNIKGNAFVAASRVKLNNTTISGDLNIVASTVDISGDVKVTGTLNINEDARINGNITYGTKSTYKTKSVKLNTFKVKVTSTLISLVTTLIFGLLFILLAPKVAKRFKEEREFGKVIGYSFLWLLLVPIVCALLLMTMVGSLAALALILVYIFTLMLSTIASGIFFGNLINTKIFKIADNRYLDLIIGLLVFKLLNLIPFVGVIIYFVFIIIGLGIVTKFMFNKIKEGRK